jgi:serine/threonine protein kinase/Flp pilus assembly protein TadD
MIGKTILHYKILEKLGEGGMGVVYKAEDTKLDRIVAIKFLPRNISTNNEERERFVVEAKAAASLNHPNIATIHSIETSDDPDAGRETFIVMEYIQGKELKQRIESAPLSINEALNIAIKIGEGLQAAHEKDIVHRDIKSDNIMLTSKGQIKIMDFGLAKMKGASKLTQAGSTVGTTAYMSPEQAQGEEVDRRSDIFSFGVVLYEMLTSRLPFQGEHQAAIIYSLVNENPQPIARFNDKVSEDLERIVLKVLSKDKEERYQHVDDALADLRKEKKKLEYASSGYIKASTVAPVNAEKDAVKRSPKNKKALKIIIPTALVVLLAIAFFIINPFKSRGTGDQPPETPKNSLAVMYFENIPDPADNGHTSEMLTNLLITSLSQVKGLEVISRERLLNIQKDLGQTDTKTISASAAEQVAKRAGVTTMLVGSILQEKPLLAVTTRLIDVQSGKIIGSQQVTNFKTDQIFNLVDSLAILIRDNFQAPSAPTEEIKSVAEVTTKSPEAYRAYVAGLELLHKLYWKEASAAFSRAIELDKDFAMAYYGLSNAQDLAGEFEAAQQSLRQAVALADKTTERERLQILAANYQWQNNLPKAIEACEQLIEKYPHEIDPYNQLGWTFINSLLQPDRAAEIFRHGLKVEPSAKTLQNGLAYSLTWMNRKQEAIEAANRYVNLAPAEPNPYDTRGDIYTLFMEYDSSRDSYQKALTLRGDFISRYKLGFDALLRQQYEEAEDYFAKSGLQLPLIEIHRGQLQNAQKKLAGLPKSQISEDSRLRKMIHISYERGQYPEMLRLARQLSDLLKKDPSNKIYGRDYLAWALIKNGQSAEAHSLVDEMQMDIQGISPALQVSADYSSALISYEEGKIEFALEKFREVMQALPPNHEPNIFYGVTMLKAEQISEAIAELQRLMFWPGGNDVYIAEEIGARYYWPIQAVKAHYWLGVAYEKQGEKDKALKEYKKFLEIWKDADFKSPEINAAKSQIMKLEGMAKG